MTDLLIVGAGIAGLSAALSAAEEGQTVTVACKGLPTWSQSVMAQGGINAALDGDTASHLADTLKAGGPLTNLEAARILCEEAPEAVRWLDRLGVLFDRDATGKLRQRPFGGATHPRTCYAADRTGHQILHLLYHRVLSTPSVTLLTHHHLLELLVADGRVGGADLWDLRTGGTKRLEATQTILATGGYGALWHTSTNARGSVGEGVAAAARAGAVLTGMEFVQFHPTALRGHGILLSEAARGEGALLINDLGERFVDELATRDVVTRAILAQHQQGRRIYLDMRPIGADEIAHKLPQEQIICRDFAGIDVTTEPVEISPAAHYTIGGIQVDPDGRTSLEGLWACGEAAATMAHGTNRLGGNSLAEAVVFGRRTGRAAADAPGKTTSSTYPDISLPFGQKSNSSAPALQTLRRDLGILMEEHAGILRSAKKLAAGKAKLHTLHNTFKNTTTPLSAAPMNMAFAEALELRAMLQIAGLVLDAATARPNSMGPHIIIQGE